MNVKIAGVPEHFNLPWHMAIEEGTFKAHGVDVDWVDVPEGTGKMCKMLREGNADLAIILSEGIIKDIAAGNPSKIVQVYVKSPLIWGIHVAKDSPYKTINDIKNTKAAISRFGSGSHLMAYVNAKNNTWNLDSLQFEVINNLEGAVKALTNGTADYFMWERFTTKPLVDSGVFRRIADCPTPWPCFVIAATHNFIDKNKVVVKHILNIVNQYTADFKQIPSIDRTLANRYGQKQEDIKTWLSLTQWGQEQLSEDTFNAIQGQLEQLQILDKKEKYREVVLDLS